MKVAGRAIVVGAMVCAVIGVMTFDKFSFSTGKVSAAQQKAAGQWVDPANPSDELVDGPYRVDPNWPKPLATLFPEEKGWTWGAVQGVFVAEPGAHLRGDARRVARFNQRSRKHTSSSRPLSD